METIYETLAMYAGTDTEFTLRYSEDVELYVARMMVDGKEYLGHSWKADLAIGHLADALLSVLA